MKTILLIFTLFVLVITGNNSFAQSAGDKTTNKTTDKPVNKIADKKGWSTEDRHTFISECMGTAISIGKDSARFYCYCMQEKIETKFPDVNDANKLSADDLQKPEWKKAAKDCLTGIGTWTSKDRLDFMTECVDAAQDALGKGKAKNYCECMLFKLEKKYPDPNDADLSEATLATPEWKKAIKDCMEF